MADLQHQRDDLQRIVDKMSTGSAVDRSTLIAFAEQILALADGVLYALDELASR